MFCWVNFTTLNSQASLGGSLVTQHNSSTKSGMSINIRYVSSTTGYAAVSTGNGSSATYRDYYGTTLLQAGIWYHLGYTYDGATIKIYVNGNCEKTQTYANMAVPANKIGIFGWSLSNNLGSFTLNGKLNDVRVYDHCLSPKEVEEIAKGLVLHYKLDNNGMGGENLFALSGVTAANSQINISNNIINVKSTGKNYGAFSMTESSYITFEAGTPYTLSGHIKSITKGEDNYTPRLTIRNSNAVIQISKPVVGNESDVTMTLTPTTTFSGFVSGLITFSSGSSNTTQAEAEFSNIKLEVGSKATTWSPSPSDAIYPADFKTTIYDSSGYSNNGTITGSLTAAAPSPRYEIATQFPGSAAIKFLDFNLGNIWSAGLWFKSPSSATQTWGSLFAVNSNGGDADFKMNIYYQQQSQSMQYSANGQYIATVTATKDTWHFAMAVFDGSTLSCYLDGALKTTKAITNAEFSRKNLVVGARSSATDGSTAVNYFNGYLSDFRIYATALTADQVKELYNTSMSIDSNGNVYARELNEL